MKALTRTYNWKAEERRVRIRDAILGMVRRYPQDGVFLLPTLDLLALLFQEPLLFTFWRKQNGELQPFLSNGEDPHVFGSSEEQFPRLKPPLQYVGELRKPRASLGAIWFPQDDGDVGAENCAVALSIHTRNDSTRQSQEYAEELERLFQHDHFWNEFKLHLRKGSESPPIRWSDGHKEHLELRRTALAQVDKTTQDASSVIDPHFAPDNDPVFGKFYAPTQFLTLLLKEIDRFVVAKESLDPIFHVGTHGFSNSDRFANLHLCVSNGLPQNYLRAREFTYTARLFFTPGQRKAFQVLLDRMDVTEALADLRTDLRENGLRLSAARLGKLTDLIEERDANSLLDMLGTPLQLKSRATADAAFTSGCVAFGHSPRSSYDRAQTEDDLVRRLTETLLYRLCQPNVRSQYIFHVPIHLNGVAWLDIFSFTSRNPAEHYDSWQHNYLLYRDVITDLGATIRQRAVDAYLGVLRELIDRAWRTPIKDATVILRSLNNQVFRLALTVPLPWMSFSTSPLDLASGRATISHRQIKDLYCSVAENPFFFRAIDYRRLKPETVAKRIHGFATKAADAVRHESLRSVAYTAHQIKNPLYTISRAVDTIPDEILQRRCRGAVDWMLALEKWLSPDYDPTKIPEIITCTITHFYERVCSYLNGLEQQRRKLIRLAPLNFEDAASDVEWAFCDVQWKAVMQTGLDNAFDHGIKDSRIELRIGSNAESRYCFIMVGNAVNYPRETLERKVAMAMEGNFNQLGIATLDMIVERFPGPAAKAIHRAAVSQGGELRWEVTIPVGTIPVILKN